jgi:hypothetical protein
MPDGTLHAFRWTESGGFEDLGANGRHQVPFANGGGNYSGRRTLVTPPAPFC